MATWKCASLVLSHHPCPFHLIQHPSPRCPSCPCIISIISVVSLSRCPVVPSLSRLPHSAPLVVTLHLGRVMRLCRTREAPDVWCPRKSQNPPSNPQGYCPQIRTFGQSLPRDFQKRQLFGFLQRSHLNPSCESSLV